VVPLVRANDLLVSQCPGQPWLLTSTRMYLGSLWQYGCAYHELRQQARGWLEEARARDDRYAMAALSGFGAASVPLALAGDHDAALEEIERAVKPWPEEPLAIVHMGAFNTSSMLHASSHQPERYQGWSHFHHALAGRIPLNLELLDALIGLPSS
jgi:hypothetical protein